MPSIKDKHMHGHSGVSKLGDTCAHTYWGFKKGRKKDGVLFQWHNQSLRALKAGGFGIIDDEDCDCLRAGAEDYLSPDKQVHT